MVRKSHIITLDGRVDMVTEDLLQVLKDQSLTTPISNELSKDSIIVN
jgi:hypothetical protein